MDSREEPDSDSIGIKGASMKSYDVCRCGAPLQVVERQTPNPVGSEVLLRVLAAGVCHSDLHFWEGVYDIGGGKQIKLVDRGVKLPLTMGHENVGEVLALGPDAEGVKVGDRRLVHPWIGCGECAVCRRGDEQLCTAPRFIGVFRAGGYADRLIVPHPRYLFDIGDWAPERAAPLACSGVTAWGALKKLGATLKSEPVIIIGAGGVGLMAVALLKAMGGRSIVADIDPDKRELAKKVGATAAIDNHASDAVKQVIDATNGGAGAVLDFVGASDTVRFGIDCLTKGGKVIVVGLFGGDVTISTPFIPIRAMTVQGSYVGNLAEMKELLDFVRANGLPDVPVRKRPLADAYAALTDLKAGKVSGRVVLTP
jgi:D-arabinose 1-dehydrogenase-like Zn-dependent alcohol dehydrogenase